MTDASRMQGSNGAFLGGSEALRPAGLVAPLGQTIILADFVRKVGDLTPEERKQIVDQALILMEQVYVHLPFKRAMHAVDPVQRLKILRQRVDGMSTRRFHDEIISTFTRLRDLHTSYLLPSPFNTMTAFLPFLIEVFFENNEWRYIVSKLFPGFRDRYFRVGAVITHWNGIAIERAVELNGELQAGSNEAARRARGLDALTTRPLIVTAPPDEDWVVVRYTDEGEVREIRFSWQILEPSSSPDRVDPNSIKSPAARALGVDLQGAAVQRTKTILFAPSVIQAERHRANMRDRAGQGTSIPSPDFNMLETSVLPGNFSFRTVNTGHSHFGYLRIWNFESSDADQFVNEFIRILELLPSNGLIIDVRGNPGGSIIAAERLLQTLTPKEIEPERLHFINTPLILALCDRDPSLTQWRDSILESLETATTYSRGFPLDRIETYNLLGQRYYGPVIVITDALCYSATDMFVAGFQDHGIGPVLGTSDNTGAGGANVWTYELLQQLFSGPASPFQGLPKNASFTVAIRRTTRVGPKSGTPVEDLGTAPDYLHRMTKNDLLNKNEDLLKRASEILEKLPARDLAAKVIGQTDTTTSLSVNIKNISRLDVYFNTRPLQSLDIRDGRTALELKLPVPGTGVLELFGFDANHVVARRRIVLGQPSHSGQGEPSRMAGSQPKVDLGSLGLRDQGVVDLDLPIRAHLSRFGFRARLEKEGWYNVVGAMLVPSQGTYES